MTRGILTAAVCVLAASAFADDKADGLAKLKGTWVAESRTFDDKAEAKADLNGLTLTIDADGFSTADKDGKTLLKGKLATPAATHVDITVAGPDGKDAVIPALYKLDGDTLTTAVPQAGGGRPTEFKAEKGSGVRVTVYQRKK